MEYTLSETLLTVIDAILNNLGLKTDEQLFIEHFTNGRKSTVKQLSVMELRCLSALMLPLDPQTNMLIIKMQKKNDNKAAKVATSKLLNELNIKVK